MKTVMISGHFAGFHNAHLDYIKQAMKHGNHILCIITSDNQLMMKKGKVTIHDEDRAEIVRLILKGLQMPHTVAINRFDRETTLVANALYYLHPDVFFRGSDKTLETMPQAERDVCDNQGIKIIHAVKGVENHSSLIGVV